MFTVFARIERPQWALLWTLFLVIPTLGISAEDKDPKHATNESSSTNSTPETDSGTSADPNDVTSQREEEKKEKEERENAAIEKLELKGKSAEDFKDLIEEFEVAREEAESGEQSATDASETGLSNQEVAKTLPIIRNIVGSLSDEQLKGLSENQELLTALQLGGDENENLRNLLMRTALTERVKRFGSTVLKEGAFALAAQGSALLGGNFRDPERAPNGACAGVECARDKLLSATALTDQTKSPIAAVRQRERNGTFPKTLRVGDREIPTASHEGIEKLALEYFVPEQNRTYSNEMNYGLRLGLTEREDVVEKVRIKDPNTLRTQAAEAAASGRGYPLWVKGEFPVYDEKGKPVLDKQGNPDTETAGHVVTVFSLGLSKDPQKRTLVVRDPNVGGLLGGVKLEGGSLSYEIPRRGGGQPWVEQWSTLIPESIYFDPIPQRARRP